jgi:hypothetical protein
MSDNEACPLKAPTRTPWNKGQERRRGTDFADDRCPHLPKTKTPGPARSVKEAPAVTGAYPLQVKGMGVPTTA